MSSRWRTLLRICVPYDILNFQNWHRLYSVPYFSASIKGGWTRATLNIAEPSSECGCSSLNKSSYCPKTTNLRIFFKLTSRNGLEAQGHVEEESRGLPWVFETVWSHGNSNSDGEFDHIFYRAGRQPLKSGGLSSQSARQHAGRAPVGYLAVFIRAPAD